MQLVYDDIAHQHLRPNDIMIIDMDTLGHEENKTRLALFLYTKREESKEAKYSVEIHLAGASSPEDFFREDSVVYTSINRAKGNEAFQVYIINAQKCIRTFSRMRERNALFTAITRSKGWVHILAYGDGSTELQTEMEKIVQNDFKLHFKPYPTDEEIKTLVRINKDLSDNNQTALNKARKAIEEISKNNPDEEIKMKLIILYREQN